MTERDSTPPMLDPVAAYARWASSYPPHAHNPLMLAEERAMLSCLPADLQGLRVLDAGCGSGRYMLHALGRGARHVVGADLSPEMLQRAAVELRNAAASSGRSTASAAEVLLVRASIAALPVPDQWADLTVCALTIGHLSSLREALAELRRVTRRSGTIVCSDFHPAAYARGERREFSVAGRRYTVSHTPHEPRDWQRACAALGLRIARTLEPHLESADLPDARRVDPNTLNMPVALVFELAVMDCLP